MSDKKQKILIVDDEQKIVEAVKAYLENSNYEVITASDGEDALIQFEKYYPDLVILDLMLPKISGEEVCRMIRRKSRVPIIMLTAKVNEDDKITGFHIGADDYLTKPFSPRELVVRVQSLLRRCSEGISPLFSIMNWNNDDLIIDLTKLKVQKSGKEINLTPNEFRILSVLVKYPNKVFTRDELIEVALGFDFEGFERTIDSHIKNLRSKIEDNSSNPKYIVTVRGIGYKFEG
ncbi:DNA-binding response OmpR family regulator [Mobilisporobacter senegalensis]|uniref:Stage 0 sporulation protein A homolog n=1 Tax=Mobilisporobacter senegalensis TaxID=1329262 RepID=A0A3N1XJZ4_9FIRM|nr:response regulator transcription factor [Mobilisporobacter senegalensis]ROR26398.1 DNA-binding response OmpR family regulator [Mobilisporobacter senegalensis]